MRLASFSAANGVVRPGLVLGEEIVDLSDPATGLPGTMREVLALGPAARPALDAAPRTSAARHALHGVRRHAPVPDPPTILGIGMNYHAHIAELGREQPEWQYWFNKQRTAIAGPGDPIVLPQVSEMVDYEGELAMVIGRRCQNVPAARALEVVAGFTIVNDVSARDWQWRTPTFTMGKSFDSHAPCGPSWSRRMSWGTPEIWPSVPGSTMSYVRIQERRTSSLACARWSSTSRQPFRLSPGRSLPPAPRPGSAQASIRPGFSGTATSSVSPSRASASSAIPSSRAKHRIRLGWIDGLGAPRPPWVTPALRHGRIGRCQISQRK